ncbi:MAG: hypothetical protein H0V66_09000 [Bdellovibrionales bacterium]|nr:hypothetical protein [Bdellovibrionales bacterium]
MKFLATLSILVAAISCSSKPITLKTHEYHVGDAAKLTVQFVKDKVTRIDIGLLGLSTKEDAVVLKKEDMGCGKGIEAGAITKFGKAVDDPFIVLPKAIFKEFYIVCESPNFGSIVGNAYIEIKKVYSFNNGSPGKVIASDIKLVLK